MSWTQYNAHVLRHRLKIPTWSWGGEEQRDERGAGRGEGRRRENFAKPRQSCPPWLSATKCWGADINGHLRSNCSTQWSKKPHTSYLCYVVHHWITQEDASTSFKLSCQVPVNFSCGCFLALYDSSAKFFQAKQTQAIKPPWKKKTFKYAQQTGLSLTAPAGQLCAANTTHFHDSTESERSSWMAEAWFKRETVSKGFKVANVQPKRLFF